MKPETAAIHAGNLPDKTNQPAIQSLTLASTFVHGNESGHMYTRASNPNRTALEKVLARLENGADAAAFSSGNAAGMSVFQALEPGSHVIAPESMYHGLKLQLQVLFKGILSFSFVDFSDRNAILFQIKPETRLIWIETPSNPMLHLADISAICSLAKLHNIISVCDNTFATPVFQQPLALGTDLVMHSSTKFLGGHSDVLGGALICKEKTPFWGKIREVQVLGGAVQSAFDCYLLTRSIKTLYYRMQGHEKNAIALAQFLESHPQVERVLYPGLESHPDHLLAKGQMSGFGAVLSFMVKGGQQKAEQVLSKLQYFTHATSLGGVESLIERRAGVEGPDTKTPTNLLRVSVGLENILDLKEDLARGLAV